MSFIAVSSGSCLLVNSMSILAFFSANRSCYYGVAMGYYGLLWGYYGDCGKNCRILDYCELDQYFVDPKTIVGVCESRVFENVTLMFCNYIH